MKVGDLVRCKYVHPDEVDVYIVEEMIDYGKDGRGSTCTLLGWPKKNAAGRVQIWNQQNLEVISEA